jgi:uncharacterized protein YigA (DUF484 family)
MQRDRYIENRAAFCKLAINNKKLAAKQLREMATGLENCRNVSDVVEALQEIFCVSERTIFNDMKV